MFPSSLTRPVIANLVWPILNTTINEKTMTNKRPTPLKIRGSSSCFSLKNSFVNKLKHRAKAIRTTINIRPPLNVVTISPFWNKAKFAI